MELAQAVIALTRSRSHCPVECDSSRYRHAADPPAGAASFADHTHASRHPFGSTDPTFIPDSLTAFRLILLPMDSRRGLSSLCREDSLTWVDSSQGGIVQANAIAFLLGHHLNSGGGRVMAHQRRIAAKGQNMKQRTSILSVGITALFFAGLFMAPVQATTLDFTATGCDASTGGCTGSFDANAIFTTDIYQSAGSEINSEFVRIQANTNEEGYNTDYSPLQFDEVVGFAHSLQLSDVGQVNYGGEVYRYFSLDINQVNPLLSLDALQIFTSDVGNLHGNTFSGDILQLGGTNSLVYNMGAGNNVFLNYNFQSLTNATDLTVLVKNSLFSNATQPYVYLYSHFGSATTGVCANSACLSNDGYEQWGTIKGDVVAVKGGTVPVPSTLPLFGFGLGALVFWDCRGRQRRQVGMQVG